MRMGIGKMGVVVTCLLQTANCFGQITFQKTYGDNGGQGADYANCIRLTLDGGYIMAGRTTSFSPNYADDYLIKVDSLGDTLWTRTIDITTDDGANSIQRTTDGGYIITGTSYLSGGGGDSTGEIHLIKTDNLGVPVWTKTYGGVNADIGNSVQQTSDGGYVIAGTTYSFGAGGSDVYLIKTNPLGDTMWTKTYGGMDDDEGYAVVQTTGRGYIIAGNTYSFGAGYTDIYLIKTDSLGIPSWEKTYGGTDYDGGRSVQQTIDGGYIIGGSYGPYGNVYLIKTNVIGDTLWTKAFGGANIYDSDWANSIQQTSDGGYIIAGGTTSFGAGHYDAYLIKTDISGDTLWSKTFGGTYFDQAYSALQTTDGGFIIAGGYSDHNPYDLYLIKTDSLGNSGCYQTSPQTIVSTPVTIVTNPPIVAAPSAAVVITPTTVIGSGGTVNVFCTTVDINELLIISLQLSISPNPSPNLFYISTKEEISSITVYSCIGEKVFTSESQAAAIDLTKAAAGIYFYSVGLKDGAVARGKLVKE